MSVLMFFCRFGPADNGVANLLLNHTTLLKMMNKFLTLNF